MRMTPNELAAEVGKGLLSFPVTPFAADGSYAVAPFREHLEWLASYKPAAFFTACGTGEFFSLTMSEIEQITRDAVATLGGKVPVIAGVGYGTAMAVEMTRQVEAAGADGILLLPPYLITPDAAGLEAHVDAVCRATKLGVTFYNRDNAILDENVLERLADRHENFVGFKDGVGDVELMVRVQNRLSGRLTFIGGLPTAETFALPYLDMGVTTYSSAIFNFAPEFAMSFHAAVLRRDHEAIHSMLRDFVLPYIAIRSRRRGYPVSIVKAGLKAVGRDTGPVRAPLTDLTATELAELASLIARISPAKAAPKMEAVV